MGGVGAMRGLDRDQGKNSDPHPLYEYVCESHEEPGFPLLHTHRILVKQRSLGMVRKWCLMVLIWVIGSVVWFSLEGGRIGKGEIGQSGLHWFVVVAVLGFFIWRRNKVEQEAVVVMPALGIQLETVYRSKAVKRRFVPLHRILWPVINEAVTPTTCFTYLALLLRDDSRLTLTFLHVRPPLSMLVPIWTALCRAVGHPPKSMLRNE